MVDVFAAFSFRLNANISKCILHYIMNAGCLKIFVYAHVPVLSRCIIVVSCTNRLRSLNAWINKEALLRLPNRCQSVWHFVIFNGFFTSTYIPLTFLCNQICRIDFLSSSENLADLQDCLPNTLTWHRICKHSLNRC